VHAVAALPVQYDAASHFTSSLWALVEDLLRNMEDNRQRQRDLDQAISDARESARRADMLGAQVTAAQAEAARLRARAELLQDVLAQQLEG
jgi:hypothetical protein